MNKCYDGLVFNEKGHLIYPIGKKKQMTGKMINKAKLKYDVRIQGFSIAIEDQVNDVRGEINIILSRLMNSIDRKLDYLESGLTIEDYREDKILARKLKG